MYGVERTGVRFVMSSPSDLDRIGDYHAWYDIYGTEVTHLGGHLVNCFRFENPAAAGSEEDPRAVAIYDIVTPDPAIAWSATENSERYPHLYDDPRAKLVSPSLRGSWAHAGSLAKEGTHGAVTGVHIILSDGADGVAREQWAPAVLETGLFYAASRFTLIEEPSRAEALVSGTRLSFPEPPTWLEIFETDQQDPLTAYSRALEALAGSRRAAAIRQRRAGSFKFYSAYQAAY
jgi:hypothetical protein